MRTNEVTCSRCRRQLRTAASRAAGIGPRCAAIEQATEGLNDTQRDKALEAIADRAVIRTSRKNIFRVVSADGTTVHTCSVTGQCTCAWGIHRHTATAKTCFHVAAARLTARPRIRRAA